MVDSSEVVAQDLNGPETDVFWVQEFEEEPEEPICPYSRISSITPLRL